MKDLFATKETQDKAVADFRALLEHPGWMTLQMIVEENVKALNEKLVSGTGEVETIEEINRTRDLIKTHNNIIGTPKAVVTRYTTESKVEVEPLDPYYTVSETFPPKLDDKEGRKKTLKPESK